MCKERPEYFPPSSIEQIACTQRELKKFLVRISEMRPDFSVESKSNISPQLLELFNDQFMKEILAAIGSGAADFSVRDAIWFVIVEPFVERLLANLPLVDEKTQEIMEGIKAWIHWIIAKAYSMEEYMNAFLNKGKKEDKRKLFDSSKLDSLLFEGDASQLIIETMSRFLNIYAHKANSDDKELLQLAKEAPALNNVLATLSKGYIAKKEKENAEAKEI